MSSSSDGFQSALVRVSSDWPKSDIGIVHRPVGHVGRWRHAFSSGRPVCLSHRVEDGRARDESFFLIESPGKRNSVVELIRISYSLKTRDIPVASSVYGQTSTSDCGQ